MVEKKPDFLKDLLIEDEEEKEKSKDDDNEEFEPDLVVGKEIKDHIFDTLNSAMRDAQRIVKEFDNANALFARLHNPLETRYLANLSLELVKYRSFLTKIYAKLKTVSHQCEKEGESYQKVKAEIDKIFDGLEKAQTIKTGASGDMWVNIQMNENNLVKVLEYSLGIEAWLTVLSEEIKRFA